MRVLYTAKYSKMKKKNTLIWTASLISIVIPATTATAQNNIEKKETISLPEKPTQLPDGTFKLQLSPDPATSYPIPSTKLFTPNLFSSPYASMLRSNPVIWNYNLSDTTKWSTRISLIPFNQLTTYIGLGEYNNLGASLLWVPANKLSLEIGAFISKQFGYILFSHQILFGTGITLNYDITDKLRFRTWGQYITSGNNDPFLNASNLFPKTNVGADLQYKATRKTEVRIGIEYQYDKQTNTWKPESGGKMKIGF